MSIIRSLKLMVAKLFGYNVPVRLIIVRGKTSKAVKEAGKFIKLHGKTTRQFSLFIENRNLPTPPNDAYIGDEVQVASSEKGKYQFCNFVVDSSKIDGIDQDMRFWSEVEVQHELNRMVEHKESFMEKHGSTIVMGIVLLICVISLVIYVKMGMIPLIEKAAGVGNQAITCNYTGMPMLNSAVTPPI